MRLDQGRKECFLSSEKICEEGKYDRYGLGFSEKPVGKNRRRI